MKNVFVADLAAGDDLDNEPFLLADIVRRETRDGRPYLLSTYRDRTGEIGGVFWDVPEDIDDWVRPGVVTLVTGRVNSYKNNLQITTTDLNPLASPNMAHYLPASKRPVAEMELELRQRIRALGEPWQSLCTRILLDDAFLPRFANAPAARNLHHAYVGGLLEHSLSMATLADVVADHYDYVNKDLLLAGTLLHDLGKALEYDTGTAFDFTEDGRLVGHIVRAITIIEQKARELSDLPPSDLQHLVHLVASHHGSLEYGSPVVPRTIEAVLLHQLDMLDSRAQGFFDHVRSDTGGDVWTGRSSYMFGATLRRPPGFE
ncbi:MAG: HD domain-containing protein [Candidatus Promineifilaceae bacterium]|nr:HD domain-containing protein [Candidatus Promineifilaceae bacterium]